MKVIRRSYGRAEPEVLHDSKDRKDFLKGIAIETNQGRFDLEELVNGDLGIRFTGDRNVTRDDVLLIQPKADNSIHLSCRKIK